VSTLEQDEARQCDALTVSGCQRMFVYKASGKLEHRPGLDACWSNSVLVTAWRDGLATWSARPIPASLDRHGGRPWDEGGGFPFSDWEHPRVNARGQADVPPSWCLAECERDLIRERTMAGLAATRARGRNGGRPTVWTTAKV